MSAAEEREVWVLSQPDIRQAMNRVRREAALKKLRIPLVVLVCALLGLTTSVVVLVRSRATPITCAARKSDQALQEGQLDGRSSR